MSLSDETATAMKQGARVVWASGDYTVLAAMIEPVAAAVIERAELGPGLDVLDVATGTGNAALPAAAAGRTRHRARPDA